MIELVATKLLESASGSAIKILEDALRRENAELIKQQQRRITAKLVTASTVTQDSIARHMKYAQDWCATISFADVHERKLVSRIYVELDTYLMPLSRHENSSERKKTKPLLEALINAPSHCALLGSAGAGKTTSLQKITADFFTKGKILLNYNFPILIRLRDLPDGSSKMPIYERIQDILSLQVEFPDKDLEIPQSVRDGISRRAIEAYLDALNVCILLDGFDEIPNSAVKSATLSNIETLSENLKQSRLILTSRPREFAYAGSAVKRFEIAPLTAQQISVFARRWLGSEHDANDFLNKVLASPFADTTIRPLTIAHLCAIYERIKDIPDKPKSVYRRIVNLLLKEWDEQRLVKRTTLYAGFDVDRKLEFLAHLAFEMTTSVKALQFDSATLKSIYLKIHGDHGLPERDVEHVVLEIESHNGLFIKSGYDTFEFAHKSLQEFLCADYIVRLPSIARIIDEMESIPNELAIATALSSKPGDYICELMLRSITLDKLPKTWFSIFALRLISEKADLVVGHNTFTIIAIFYLLHNVGPLETLIDSVKYLIPKDAIAKVGRYYTVTSRTKSTVEFTRTTERSDFKLPSQLSVPRTAAERSDA